MILSEGSLVVYCRSGQEAAGQAGARPEAWGIRPFLTLHKFPEHFKTSSNHNRPIPCATTPTMALVKQADDELVIKPEAVAPNINYADWPLLLKNWDQRGSLYQMVIGRTAWSQSLRSSRP